MMTIANRLEKLAMEHYEMLDGIHVPLLEARDEINRLSSAAHAAIVERNMLLREYERLRTALGEIAEMDWKQADTLELAIETAKEALEQ